MGGAFLYIGIIRYPHGFLGYKIIQNDILSHKNSKNIWIFEKKVLLLHPNLHYCVKTIIKQFYMHMKKGLFFSLIAAVVVLAS
ncbi:MAG: hypothetical protein IJV61_05465, partial [Paludibacteraceae bacterium]|nr:hypothetical protein [Paludibacteraceae bacterium]